MNYDSPAQIRAELEQHGLALKKRWGQNFLINRGARESLVAWLAPAEADLVWEIGPGLGAMTELIMSARARCVAFEIDRGLCTLLDETFRQRNGFTLVVGDFVRTWRTTLRSHGPPQLLLGNLPYRSASLMIADIIDGGLRPRRSVVTVQREAAERICSKPGLKSYSSFSVLCQAVFVARILGDLKPGSFYPPPEVTSTVVELVPREDAPIGPSLEILGALTRGLFASRRKMIRNNMAAAKWPAGMQTEHVAEALQANGVDLSARAESLSPEVFVSMARGIATRQEQSPREP